MSDWTFLNDPAVMRAADMATRKAARKFPNSAHEDCLQEAMCYLGSHPETVNRYRSKHEDEDEFVRVLAHTIYANGLRYALVKDSDRLNKQDPWPEDE